MSKPIGHDNDYTRIGGVRGRAQNLERRPAPTFAADYFWAFGSASATVTTPWTMNAVNAAYSTFLTDGSGTFTEDSSNQGVQCNLTGIYTVRAHMKVTGVGHAVPPDMRIIFPDFAPGTPSTSSFPTDYVAEMHLPSALDNLLPSVGIYLRFFGRTSLLAGRSYGLGIQAAGAAANWTYEITLTIEST